MLSKKIFILASLFLILFSTGCTSKIFSKKEAVNNDKKVLVVVTPINFYDEEYRIIINELEQNDIEFKIASIQKGNARSLNGETVNIDLMVSEAKAENFSAVIFLGGKELELISDDDTLKLLAFQFNQKNKIVAAINNAPIILAKSGIIKGKQVTATALLKGKIISIGSANFLTQAVAADGKIITADSSAASEAFIKKIITMHND
ncbi:MAG: ThiJ/PfpI domain-containing protein [Parcubacteria group bacterium GW2011_GWE2_39_37]|nr:MAG: ThiJ/PfpI domain-containing protein [Parcubacteria group bacterium GW2011_GWE2_39_37]